MVTFQGKAPQLVVDLVKEDSEKDSEKVPEKEAEKDIPAEADEAYEESDDGFAGYEDAVTESAEDYVYNDLGSFPVAPFGYSV